MSKFMVIKWQSMKNLKPAMMLSFKCVKTDAITRKPEGVILMSSDGGLTLPYWLQHKFTIFPSKSWPNPKINFKGLVHLAQLQLSWWPLAKKQLKSVRAEEKTTNGKKTYQMWLLKWIICQWERPGQMRRSAKGQPWESPNLKPENALSFSVKYSHHLCWH